MDDEAARTAPEGPSPGAMPGGGSPLFILSFRHRDELADIAARSGWQPIAARRRDDALRRFLRSGARVAVIDGRGAVDDGLAAVRVLADAVEANGAGLLVLLSRGEADSVSQAFDAGATGFLLSPFGETELVASLRFALRHAERAGGGGGAHAPRDRILGWAFESGVLSLSPALAGRFPGDRTQTAATLLRSLDRSERQKAIEAMRRLGTGGATAFTHRIEGSGQVAHHLRIDPATGAVRGVIEMLGPDGRTRRSRDRLTGLSDGLAVRAWVDRGLAEGHPVSLILLGIAGFDAVVQAYGRDTGDMLLREAARRIERLAGEFGARNALAARVAGGEFLIALRGVDIPRARLMAGNMLAALARPFVSGGAMLTLGAHAGIAEHAAGDGSAAPLIRRASAALADARMAEGEQIRVVTGAEAEAVDARGGLEADLREALARGQIEVLYQPQVTLSGRRVTGVEALARWRHPTLGTLGAETLFAAADRAGLSAALSAEVQARAIGEAAGWSGPLASLRLSVNVTAADLAEPRFGERALDLADRAGFPRRRLTLEVTEGGLIADLAMAADVLAQLRAAGCRVAIDDFGTGYSSLAYLKALPLDYLKLDRRLSQDIEGSPRDRVVVRGAIDMARSLGLAVIAEGVETEEQAALLAAEGCTLYQGFLFSPPVAASELEALIAG